MSLIGVRILQEVLGHWGMPETVRAYAHRGGTEVAPENTLAAFAHATSLGYVDLETDVRATRDGVAIVMHDTTLDRTTDRGGRVRDVTWSEVSRARIGGVHPVPRLDEFLASFPEARVNLDLKDATSLGPLADAVARTGAALRVCITSFSARRLRAARRTLPPAITTSAHPPEVLRSVLRARTGRGLSLPPGSRLQIPEFAAGRRLLDHRLLSAAHRAGIAVDVWTVNDRADMERLADWGVDGIMTDRPTLLREVLQERGRWGPIAPHA